ncbi:MAG: hypothetical protein ACRENT_02360 [Thermodesulfobacteriota bacterium]
MQNGDLVYSLPMRTFLGGKNKTAQFNNEVHYGILKYKNSYVAVVYKPKEGSDISAAYAEKVAYDIYEKAIAPYTGNHVIPPTIVRAMPDGRVASCQFFVETGDQEDMWNSVFREAVFTSTSESIQEMAVYNTIFNNWDNHPGNYLATWREGCFHLASIDNEAIENKGYLPEWGERNYVPVFFTNDDRASVQKELRLPKDITLADFNALLLEHGFKEVPRIKTIFNNLVDRGDSHRICLIANGVFWVRFHQGNQEAFPSPKGPYSQILIETYRRLDRAILGECFRPLVELDPERFSTRVSDILARRDMFLNSLQQPRKLSD